MKRKLFSNKEADTKMITLVIGIMITLAISVLILYNIMGSIDTDSIDGDIAIARGYTNGPTVGDDANSSWTNYNASVDATNATDEILDQAEVFYTLAPLIVIVIVAVVIIGYVSKI